MFKRLSINGTVVDATGKPAERLGLVLEVFIVGSGWSAVMEAVTGTRGEFKSSQDVSGFEEVRTAPQVRLTAQNGSLVLNAVPNPVFSRRTLLLDFGTVTVGDVTDRNEAELLRKEIEKLAKTIDNQRKQIEELSTNTRPSSPTDTETLGPAASQEIVRMKTLFFSKLRDFLARSS